jgi:hypothetical protein
MHRQVEAFLTDPAQACWFDEAAVVEVGSYNVNGSARTLVGTTARHWLGIDRLPGPGVDLVGDAADVLHAFGLAADVVVSTEALEHDPTWGRTVRAMCRAVRRAGTLVVTCAGPGRAPHAADGSGGPRPGEYYGNVDPEQLRAVLEDEGMTVVLLRHVVADGDLQLVARKP